MGSFSFPVPSSVALTEAFSDMPQSMKAYMKEGFVVLSRLSPDKFTVVANIAVQAVQTPYRVDIEDSSKQLGISTDEMGTLLPAISFLTAFVSSRNEKPEEVVSAAAEAKIIPESSRQAVSLFSQALALQREGLRNDLDRSKLATRVLPSLIEFEVIVDLRLHPSKIDMSVPVAVAHVDTDIAHTELWFQMQKADVERLIDSLQKVQKQMSDAEKIVLRRDKSQ